MNYSGNIPGNAVTSGEDICHYISPFPARGTGFHRYAYILFKQDGPVDFSADLRPAPWWVVLLLLTLESKNSVIITHLMKTIPGHFSPYY